MSNVVMADKAEMRDLSSIRPYDKNPRKNDKTVDLLVKMIPKVGFNVPLVIDEDGVIVKGHARYLAAKKLGMKKVPCITTRADKDAVRADRIADNKVQEFSKWNNEELMHEVDMLDLDYDFSDMGLPRASFDDIPTFDDFDNDEFEEETYGMTDEEKRKKYFQLLEEQAEEELEMRERRGDNVKIATLDEIRNAMAAQRDVPKKQKEYVKCVCKRCGHVFYFDKNVYYSKDGTTRL